MSTATQTTATTCHQHSFRPGEVRCLGCPAHRVDCDCTRCEPPASTERPLSTIRPTRADYGRALADALRAASIHRRETAQLLGCSRSTLYRRLTGRSCATVIDYLAVAHLTGRDPADILQDAYRHAQERDGGQK